jgi:hypothetical protein
VASWPTIARRIRVPSGFVFAAVYLWLAKPDTQSLEFAAPLVVAGLLLRGVASGHLQKNEQLATSGPYAYTRNPLYLGSLIIAVGFAIAARSWWIALIMVGVFAAIYLPVIRAEELDLAQRFPDFADYARRVPRLLPKPIASGNSSGSFSWELYCKHREYNAVLGSLCVLAALLAKLLWMLR